MFDYLIVGAGFAGSVLAERLANRDDRTVLVVDKRPHIAGNAYDHYDDAGILVHQYGPHIFHCNSKEIFDYLSPLHRVAALPAPRARQRRRAARADPDQPRHRQPPLRAEPDRRGDGRLPREPWPNRESGSSTAEDAVVSKVGRDLYDKFFRGYTRKQWGVDPRELDAQVTARIPTRTNRDDRYFTDRYPGDARTATPGCSSGCSTIPTSR